MCVWNRSTHTNWVGLGRTLKSSSLFFLSWSLIIIIRLILPLSPFQSWWNVIVMADETCRVLLDRPGKGSPMSLIIFLSCLFQFIFFVILFHVCQKRKEISFPVERNIIWSVLQDSLLYIFIPDGMRPWKYFYYYYFLFSFVTHTKERKDSFVCVPFLLFFFFFVFTMRVVVVRSCVRSCIFCFGRFFTGKKRNDAAVVSFLHFFFLLLLLLTGEVDDRGASVPLKTIHTTLGLDTERDAMWK